MVVEYAHYCVCYIVHIASVMRCFCLLMHVKEIRHMLCVLALQCSKRKLTLLAFFLKKKESRISSVSYLPSCWKCSYYKPIASLAWFAHSRYGCMQACLCHFFCLPEQCLFRWTSDHTMAAKIPGRARRDKISLLIIYGLCKCARISCKHFFLFRGKCDLLK